MNEGDSSIRDTINERKIIKLILSHSKKTNDNKRQLKEK